jgi:hypothetical protein
LSLLLVATSAGAASLTLGCSGTLTTTDVPKDKVANDPKEEKIVDFSVVVDFDRRSVSGFWVQMNGVHDLIPITAVDANSVTFSGRKKESIDKSIEGTVDRISGKIDTSETWLWRTGSLSILTWDLRCKPTKPLF